jgi:hypothetical protein
MEDVFVGAPLTDSDRLPAVSGRSRGKIGLDSEPF